MKIEALQRVNRILILCALIIAGLYYGASLLVPFSFAIFLAALVFPVVNFLEKTLGTGRIASSLIGVLLVLIGVGSLTYFFVDQLDIFVDEIVDRQEEITRFLQRVQKDLVSHTGLSIEQQENMFRERMGEIFSTTQSFISQLLTGVGEILLDFLIVLVYLFLLLLNRDKFVDFAMMYTSKENEAKVKEIIAEARTVAHRYLWGRIQVMFLLALMYIITFTAYDLRHAWLLVIFGSLITVIPYVGPFLSAVLPMLFMLIFGDSSLEILSFTAIVFIIQMIESYVFEPIIIGSEVHQSPLFVIIAILLGGTLWGVAGLILFVPIFAILKILFDHTSNLKPIGFLLGYERSGSGEGVLDKIKEKIKG